MLPLDKAKKIFQNFIYSSLIFQSTNETSIATPSIAPSTFPIPPKKKKNSQKNPSITYSKAKCPIIRRIPAEYASGGRGGRGVCRVTIEKLRASFRFTWRIDFPPPSLSVCLTLFPFPRKRHRGEKRRYLSKEQPVGLNRSWVGSMVTGNTATKAEFPGVGWKRSTALSTVSWTV